MENDEIDVSLFRAFFLLSLNREELERQKHKKFSQTPLNLCQKICRHPPLENGSTDALLEQIFRFTFPESVAKLATLGQERQDRLQAQFYTFVLTDADGGRSYGFCLRGANYRKARIDVGQQYPECFCFVTSHPHFNLFRALLSLAAAARWRNGQTGLMRLVAAISRAQPKPNSEFSLFKHMLYRPSLSSIPTPPLHPLLSRMTMPNLLRLISATLCERRILVLSPSVGVSSACIHALLTLLYPFLWKNILLPVVPNDFLTFAMSPTPFIMGLRHRHLTAMLRSGLPLTDVVVADMTEGTVTVMPNESTNPIKPLGDPDQVVAIKLGTFRTQHGTFNTLRLRKDLQAYMARGQGTQGVFKRSGSVMLAVERVTALGKLGLKNAAERLGSPKVKTDPAPIDTPGMGKMTKDTGVFDEHAIRVSMLAFFVRVFRGHNSAVQKKKWSARGAGGERVERRKIDMAKFVAHQPDHTLKEIILQMEESQMLQWFVQQYPTSRVLAPFRSMCQKTTGRMKWAQVKKVVSDALLSHPHALDDSRDDALRVTSNVAMADSAPVMRSLAQRLFDWRHYDITLKVIWGRLRDSKGSNFRHATLGLALLHHLVVNSSARVLVDLRENMDLVSELLHHSNPVVRSSAKDMFVMACDRNRLVWELTRKQPRPSRVRKVHPAFSYGGPGASFKNLHARVKPKHFHAASPVIQNSPKEVTKAVSSGIGDLLGLGSLGLEVASTPTPVTSSVQRSTNSDLEELFGLSGSASTAPVLNGAPIKAPADNQTWIADLAPPVSSPPLSSPPKPAPPIPAPVSATPLSSPPVSSLSVSTGEENSWATDWVSFDDDGPQPSVTTTTAIPSTTGISDLTDLFGVASAPASPAAVVTETPAPSLANSLFDLKFD